MSHETNHRLVTLQFIGGIMNQHEKINYIELPAKDFIKTKAFFSKVFNWNFTDYGSEYMAFSNSGLEGGFYKSDLVSSAQHGSVLVAFYSKNLEETLAKIQTEKGEILKPIFSFPGGRRFHFADPNGNEYAVWSDILES